MSTLMESSSMSPTKPKSISLTNRFVALINPASAPQSPIALQFIDCNLEVISALMSPLYDMTAMSRVCLSVILLPS